MFFFSFWYSIDGRVGNKIETTTKKTEANERKDGIILILIAILWGQSMKNVQKSFANLSCTSHSPPTHPPRPRPQTLFSFNWQKQTNKKMEFTTTKKKDKWMKWLYAPFQIWKGKKKCFRIANCNFVNSTILSSFWKCLFVISFILTRPHTDTPPPHTHTSFLSLLLLLFLFFWNLFYFDWMFCACPQKSFHILLA